MVVSLRLPFHWGISPGASRNEPEFGVVSTGYKICKIQIAEAWGISLICVSDTDKFLPEDPYQLNAYY